MNVLVRAGKLLRRLARPGARLAIVGAPAPVARVGEPCAIGRLELRLRAGEVLSACDDAPASRPVGVA